MTAIIGSIIIMYEEKLNIISLDARLLLEKLIKILPFPAYIKDGSGQYLICNVPFADKIFGVTSDELIGKCINDFLHLVTKDEAAYYTRIDNELLKNGGDKQFETDMLCADGLVHHFHEIKTAFMIDFENTGIIGIMIDLTESNNLEAAFAEQEKYLKIFMDYIPDAVFFKNGQGEYLKVNNTKALLLGARSENEVIGKNYHDFFDEIEAKEIYDEEKEIIDSGIILSKEESVLFPDGKERWLYTTKVPFPNADGSIAGIFGISRDITDKKRNELDLDYKLNFEKLLSKISNYFMRAGYLLINDGLFYASKKLNIFFNSEFAHIFFINNDKLDYQFSCGDERRVEINEEYTAFLTGEFRETLKDYHTNLIESKYLVISVNEDEQEECFLYLPLFNDQLLVGVIILDGIKLDISLIERNGHLFTIFSEILGSAFEMHSMEKDRIEIEKEMHKMVRAVEQSANIVMILDARGKTEYVNPRFYELSGYSTNEVLGKSPIEFTRQGNELSTIKEMWGTINSGREWNGLFLCEMKNKSKKWFNTLISPIMNNGVITNFLAILEDVTEKIYNQNRVAVSQKLEAIGQLAAGIAHEINTPMQFIGDNNTFLREAFSSILNYISDVESLISEEGESKSKIEEIRKNSDFSFIIEEIPSALDQSKEGINRVSNIVKAMKEFAHPGVKEKAFSDINKAIRNTAAISKNEWKYYSDLDLQLDESLPLVFCEIDSINQVLLNMIVNAAHAIEKISDKIPCGKGKITIRTENLEESVCITIKDTGCGIPKDHLDRIFDPFFTTKKVGKGTGQGLAIVHDIIENKHNGIIQVDSEINEGTEFKLFLPINDKDAR